MPLVAIWAAPTAAGEPRAAKFRGPKTYKEDNYEEQRSAMIFL